MGAYDEKLGPDLDVVQCHQHLTFLDEIALPDRQRFDDAAVPVLDLFQVLIDLHGAGGHDSAFQVCDRRPSAAADHQQNHERQTTQDPWPQPKGPFGVAGDRGWRGVRGELFRTEMFHGLIPRLPDADGELKVMMSGKFDGIEVIGVGPIVDID